MLPATGLTSEDLLTALRLIGRAAEAFHEELEELGFGQAPRSWWEMADWPKMPGTFSTEP